MALNAAWEFSKLMGDAGVVRAVEWVIVWTDPDYPGTEVRSGGVTVDGISIAVETATKREIEVALEASLGPQMDTIRAHAAEVMAFRHTTESLPAISLPDLVKPEPLRPLSRRQLLLTLHAIGIAEAQIDAVLADDPLGTIEWRAASQFERGHPLVSSLGEHFALPEDHIDSLWRHAQDL